MNQDCFLYFSPSQLTRSFSEKCFLGHRHYEGHLSIYLSLSFSSVKQAHNVPFVASSQEHFFRHENSCFRRRIRHKLLAFGTKSTIFGKYVILKNETYKSLLYFTNMSLRNVSGKMLCLSAMKFFNTENSLSTGTDVHGANL